MFAKGRFLLAAVVLGVSLAGARAEAGGDVETVSLPGGVTLELVSIAPGTFLMGQKAGEQDAYPNKETPQHPVTVSRGFLLGKYEVTKDQWRAVMGTAPWAGKEYVNEDGNSPATHVSWEDARAFAGKLTEVTGKPFRLPTEAEWEYACRAGTETRFYWGDDPTYEDIDRQAWWRGNAAVTPEQYARPVGTMPPNPWGLFDMSGNVSEWCEDWHGYYLGGPAKDPVGPPAGEHRVLRGGSWLSIGGHCRSSRRHHELPTMAHSDFGFRVACAPAVEREPGSPETVDVFKAGTEGIDTYRIPAMLTAPDGSLLVFCEARKVSMADASPTDMVLRRSVDDGRTWLPMQTLVRAEGSGAIMNPCAVVDRSNGRILLFCIDAHKLGPDRHQYLLLTSDDNGKTWSEPVHLEPFITNPDDRFVSGPGVGVQMQSGRIVIPGYSGEINEEFDENFYSRVIYSDDHGKTWTFGAPVPQMSDESQAVELNDGTLMLNVRGNMGTSCRGVALSRDGGETWSKFYWDRALNECPCQASIFCYGRAAQDGKDRLLFANPDNAGERFGNVERTKMTVRLSYDEGKTWPVERLIHGGPSSYSTLVRLSNGDIGLVFEGGDKQRREWIRFVRFSLAWLTNGTDAL